MRTQSHAGANMKSFSGEVNTGNNKMVENEVSKNFLLTAGAEAAGDFRCHLQLQQHNSPPPMKTQ